MNSKLTPAEEQIMDYIWKEARWITIRDIMEHFEKNGKNWKRQTINTFLNHLIDKGFLIKNGRKYIYTYRKEEFQAKAASDFLDKLYDGSVKKFISALSGTKKLTQKDASELKEYLDKLSKLL